MRRYAPIEGYQWNPLLKVGPNEKCPCDSGKKFKKCHSLTLPRAVPTDVAKKYQEGMKTAEVSGAKLHFRYEPEPKRPIHPSSQHVQNQKPHA